MLVFALFAGAVGCVVNLICFYYICRVQQEIRSLLFEAEGISEKILKLQNGQITIFKTITNDFSWKSDVNNFLDQLLSRVTLLESNDQKSQDNNYLQ